LLHDIHYALRSLRRSPSLVITALAALTLGIGANTAIFSVINAVMLRPLSYPDPDRLVQVALNTKEGKGRTLSIPEFLHCRAQTGVLQDVAAYDFGGPGVNLTGGDQPEQVKGIHVSADYFRLFGAPVVLGRTFSAEEDRPGGVRVVVIGNGLWRRGFAADPALAGKTISLGNEPYVVIGVLRQNFDPDPPADLWLPLQADANSVSQAHYIRVAARLKPGVTLSRVQTQLKLSAAEFRRKFPLFDKLAEFGADPLRDSVVTNVRAALLILGGTVSFVLLIACANVANLLLARTAGRRREIAIRAALGAGRRRIVAQLLTESLLLSVSGGLLGLVVGYLGVRALLAINPGDIPRIGEQGSAVTLDWRVLAFTAGVSVITSILFGLMPALSASRVDLSAAIQEGGSRSGSALRQNKARSLLVVTEVALALVLLMGAALLIRTFAALRAVDPGIDVHDVLTCEMSLSGKRFETSAGIAQVVRDVEQRVGSLPGVVAVSSSWSLPLELAFSDTVNIEGRPLGNGPIHGIASMRPVSPQYFGVFRIPLLRGRLFTQRDDGAASGVVLISQAMAKKFWPDGEPLGERLSIDKYMGPEFAAPPRQIIGIVGDARDRGLNRYPEPMMYLPQAQVPDGLTALHARILPITWVVRTRSEPYSLSAAIQEELREASGGLPVSRIRSMERVVGQSTARSDFNTVLLVAFAGIALGLAAIGIYGVMAYSVQQRTQEMGVRMALGATPQQVRNMVVFQGMRLALSGVVLGVAASLGLTRVMASLIYGVSPSDPVVISAVCLQLSIVALVATYVPSRRATRIDPVEALRHE
jgi:predicted permease